MHIVMIIPTYNEKDNIGLLIDRLKEEFCRILHEKENGLWWLGGMSEEL